MRAYIDGRDRLIVKGNTLQWQHFEFAAVGRWGGGNRPTEITTTLNTSDVMTAYSWIPTWPVPPPDEIRFFASSDVFAGLDPPLAAQDQTVTLTPIAARESVSIVQQPSAANDYTLIVEFNDNVTGFAEYYEVLLSFQVSPYPCIMTPLTGSTPRSMFIAVHGSANQGSRVSVWMDGTVRATTDVDAEGTWEKVLFAGLGNHEIRAQYENFPGSLSGPVAVSVSTPFPNPIVDSAVFEKLKRADIILTRSLFSFQIQLYGPQYSHAALYLGGDSDGTPMIAEAAMREAGTLGQVRAAPLEWSMVYTDGRVVDLFRPVTPLAPTTRSSIVGWAKGMTTGGVRPYWNILTDFGAFAVAAGWWDFTLHRPRNDARFQQALNNINNKKRKTDAFMCSTLVWRAYLEGTSGTLDISQPNNIVIQPASILGKWSGDPAFIDRLRPNFVLPDTLGSSPKLSKVP